MALLKYGVRYRIEGDWRNEARSMDRNNFMEIFLHTAKLKL